MDLSNRLEGLLYRVTKPSRYIGNEWNVIKKDWQPDLTKVVMAFPDLYEIGMSHLGLKIIYHLLNQQGDILCERVYAPWTDMEDLMRKEEIPLFSLESRREIRDFDIFGFTLQYEMSYTNILNMLDLANIPLYSRDRDEAYPLVIAGGSTVYNPEPLTSFIDLFFIGEAEEGIVTLVRKYKELQKQGLKREEILYHLSQLPGVYVPRFYDLKYKEGGVVSEIFINREGVKPSISRQIVSNLDEAFYPVDFIVPYHDIVHDRAVIEIARGCTRGCRFCAAGISYRPVRERKKETVIRLADEILESTGYEELSLTSLSAVDYSDIAGLVKSLAHRYEDKKISISLPSLRVDRFSVNLAKEVQRVRKSGLTFAPEAGTQRLRDVINKGVNEEDIFEAVKGAFEEGWSTIKLYFMMGLPLEQDEDLAGISKLVKDILKLGKSIRSQRKKRMRAIKIHVSVSTFVPKPFTPFQWAKMDGREEIVSKQNYLINNIKGRGLSLSWNDPELSLLEGVFSRGDRRLGPVLESAWRKGCRFDGWSDSFDFENWRHAFQENELSIEEYLRARDVDEILPWDHINMGVSKEFLQQEYQLAEKGVLTEDCRNAGCTGCDICSELNTKLELVGDN
ncbi:TIGR03960 family B12-binding radical SAM protein [Iocasia frigidifontis]|uniref:TIGR03960 family B12-binding radical SAM protein n=1 Tax=Iocasia fonsfrigidae TaxID=2682810 RepID=A0A8A7KB02_9FIRM|nr:TIGR03960 family B12-binding radical SAM protein [Iocasia fonsfrigidae]QTL97265.1 TIGR03960 family B12-binding radical SAM protein [Iocasia fonsfrigidae]